VGKISIKNGVEQVVFHITTHGIGQDNLRKVKKGAIILAQLASPSQQN